MNSGCWNKISTDTLIREPQKWGFETFKIEVEKGWKINTNNRYNVKKQQMTMFLTLCAGMRLIRMVSSSSCVTPSPSMIMELIKSIMCICTFWLWLLLQRQQKRDKNNYEELLSDLLLVCIFKTFWTAVKLQQIDILGRRHHSSLTRPSLDDREERFEKLNKDLVAVLQLKAYVVGLHPCQVLDKNTKGFSWAASKTGW